MMFDRDHDRGGRKAPFVAPAWNLGRVSLSPDGRPLVMGIVNLTDDSFFAGSRVTDTDLAVKRCLGLIDQGADLLDLGAESSRPGAQPVSAHDEQDRLVPVLKGLRTVSEIPVTIDTVRASTAAAALDAGADAVNDITGGTGDPGMFHLVADRGCGLVLMHMQGTPSTMQDDPRYSDVIAEVRGWLAARVKLACEAGIGPDRLMVDPGIGFGKTLEHNLDLLRNLESIGSGRPLLLGASRKRFIEAATGAAAEDRLPGSLAALTSAWAGRASVVRVHDVAATVQFLDVLQALAQPSS